MAHLFTVDTDINQIKKITNDHIVNKKRNEERGILYYLGKGVELIIYGGAWLLKNVVGFPLSKIGDFISSFKLIGLRYFLLYLVK